MYTDSLPPRKDILAQPQGIRRISAIQMLPILTACVEWIRTELRFAPEASLVLLSTRCENGCNQRTEECKTGQEVRTMMAEVAVAEMRPAAFAASFPR